ncbi:proteolipid protein 1b isoform X1 [Electrophorus electricus]|uniref:Proteolipid protein 1b n=1 Tax=Electrophorus electricus TaxID=8005 RepID=A0A4W4E3X0_ELEEL|nr:proteolipid protein 1b isoform X1 [Electrophorus electricus]
MFPVKQPWLCKALGCYDCCVRCLGAVPYVSLAATLLCYAGLALFCAGGHQALAHTSTLVQMHFARSDQDYIVLADFIKYFQYVIYGLASFFFLYGILLLAEGFYTTSAVKQTFGEFRSTRCSRCLSLTFITMTYVFAVIWLVVFAFSTIPVFFLYNMEETCHTVNILSETTASINQHAWVCMDARQYGLLPWNAVPGKVCGMSMANICKTPEFYVTYDLYITAFAGAGITLLALVLYIVATTYNYAVLRFLGRKGIRC